MAAIGITVLGFLMMEGFSWFIHRYLMHGVLWKIHQTHHRPTKGFFELNDLFTVFFGSIAVVLIFLGMPEYDYRFWLGVGVSLYGMVYFIFHDVLIHRRIKVKSRLIGKYFLGIKKAHADHHKSPHRDGSVCFGLLVVPRKYFRK